MECQFVGVGECVQVFLRRLDLGVTEAFHDGFEVGSASEEPGCVSVPQVVHSNRKAKVGGGHRGDPVAGAEGVAAERVPAGGFGGGK